MKKLLSFILIILFTTSYSQTLIVTDLHTNTPIENVVITNINNNQVVITNENGKAPLVNSNNSDKLQFRVLGYKLKELSVIEIIKHNNIVNLKPEIFTLNKIIVSASKHKQNYTKVPVRINTLSPRSIQLENPQTSADLLGESGEVYIQKSQQGGGSPMIRGFATNRLLYSVDGVRMNTAIFRSGNLQNVISLDPFEMKNVEIMLGPSSVVYGSDAIGGVMNFQTLIPKLSTSSEPQINGKGVLRFATANQEKTYHSDISIGWQKWAYLASFSSNNFGDLTMGSNGPNSYLRPFYVKRINNTDVIIENKDSKVQVNTGYKQINTMHKIRFKPNNNLDINFGFHYSETSNYDRYDRLIILKDLPKYAEWYYGPQKWMMNNLEIHHEKQNVFYDELTLNIAYQKFEESRINRKFNDSLRKIRVEKVDASSVNFDFLKKIGTKTTITYGLETVYDNVNSKGNEEDLVENTIKQTGSRYPKSYWFSSGIYLNTKINISNLVNLDAGIRFNKNILHSDFDTSFYHFPYTSANINNNSITGNIGLVFQPTETFVIKPNLSTGFRSPNVDDMSKVFDSEQGAVVVPNTDLKPERAYNIELGITKWNKFIKVDASIYYTWLKNAMVRRDFMLNNESEIMYDGVLSQVQAIQNASTAYVYGFEAGVKLKLNSNFVLSSQFNYQKGEEETDDGLKSAIRHAEGEAEAPATEEAAAT